MIGTAAPANGNGIGVMYRDPIAATAQRQTSKVGWSANAFSLSQIILTIGRALFVVPELYSRRYKFIYQFWVLSGYQLITFKDPY